MGFSHQETFDMIMISCALILDKGNLNNLYIQDGGWQPSWIKGDISLYGENNPVSGFFIPKTPCNHVFDNIYFTILVHFVFPRDDFLRKW